MNDAQHSGTRSAPFAELDATHPLVADIVAAWLRARGNSLDGDAYVAACELAAYAIQHAPARSSSDQLQPYVLRFPTMLRKMWSGGDVQAWLDGQPPLFTRTPVAHHGQAASDFSVTSVDGGNGNAPAAAALDSPENPGFDPRSVRGELVKLSVSQSAVLGGSLSIRSDERAIHLEGISEAMARACSPLLFKRVGLVVRPESDTRRPTPPSPWLSADMAAFESRVDLGVLIGWIREGEIECRDCNRELMVSAASVRQRAHRYWREQLPSSTDAGPGDAS
ncbi:hypothetical protein [Burkholderia glumae]|uniref:hypothetical protein n=1 Tax=Burkholderia glumae TaxID=337 RepID=UPI002150AC95|nr:hypothetical protein [Burkholderia glumae]